MDDPELIALEAIALRHPEFHLQRLASGWALISYIPNGTSTPFLLDSGQVNLPGYDVVTHAFAPSLHELNTSLAITDAMEAQL